MADLNSNKDQGDANLPSSRKEAKEAGCKSYFTGKPCPAGHIASRATINGACCECQRVKSASRYWADREANLAYQKVRRDSDPSLNQKKQARRDAADPALKQRREARAIERSLREAASEAKETTYRSIFPCSHGHEPVRFARDGKCAECNRLACAERFRRKQDPDAVAARKVEAQKRARRRLERQESARIWHEAGAARQAAIASGARTYYSPKPCPEGHVGERYTTTGTCMQCLAAQSSSDEKKRYDAIYYRENLERILARSRIYNENNREQRVEQAKRWRERNPEKRKAIIRNYSAKRRAKEADGISTAELHAWTQSQKKVCYWCGSKCEGRFHVDHYVPLSKGGPHEAGNLVIACPQCNLKKNAKDPYEFAASLGRLF